MSSASIRSGLAGLPPSNVLAANTFNPVAQATVTHPLGFPPGTPVVQSLVVDRAVFPGRANNIDTSSLVGLTIEQGVPGNPVLTQFNGVITLTTEEWDAVTGGVGGLALDTRYYLSAATEGRLTAIPPSGGGELIESVGISLSTTDLQLQLCAPTATNVG